MSTSPADPPFSSVSAATRRAKPIARQIKARLTKLAGPTVGTLPGDGSGEGRIGTPPRRLRHGYRRCISPGLSALATDLGPLVTHPRSAGHRRCGGHRRGARGRPRRRPHTSRRRRGVSAQKVLMLRGIRRGRGCCDEGVVFSPGTRSRETIATFHIFNTARRKWLKIHDFEQSFVESRCCCRRVESRSPTVTRVEQRTTEHHIVAGRAMSLTTPQT